MKSNLTDFYIYDIDQVERKGFNVIFGRAFTQNWVDMGTVRKWLSGVRIDNNSLDKVDRDTINSWLWNWHKLGLISISHGRIRLGSVGLYANLLNDKNKKLILKEIG